MTEVTLDMAAYQTRSLVITGRWLLTPEVTSEWFLLLRTVNMFVIPG